MEDLARTARFEDPNFLPTDENFSVMIKAEEGKIYFETHGEARAEPFIAAMTTVILEFFKKAVENAPAGKELLAKEALYNLLNISFSGTLRLFAPEYTERPDLTADAIRQAEDSLIDEAYVGTNRQQRRQAARELDKIKKAVKPRS